MSLWTKLVENLTFEDLDGFLRAKVPEGHRLDYKATMPSDLEKVIAAFANTLGGMIVIGVDEDSRTGEPVWPPDPNKSHHLLSDSAVKLQEQVTSRAQQGIYPPVRVQVGRVIPNTHVPGKQLLVVRVDESEDAPHAVERKQQVFIVEKSDSVSDRFKLADIDRIEAMLTRRRMIVERREALIEAALDRSQSAIQIPGRNGVPVRWLSIIPYFPWRQVCDKSLCYSAQKSHWPSQYYHQTVQRVPRGSYSAGRERADVPIQIIAEAHDNGHLFVSQCLCKAEIEQRAVFADDTVNLLSTANKFLKRWYSEQGVELPGLCRYEVGFENVLDFRMASKRLPFLSNHPCVYPRFRVSTTFELTDFHKDSARVTANVFDEVLYCFDSDTLTDTYAQMKLAGF